MTPFAVIRAFSICLTMGVALVFSFGTALGMPETSEPNEQTALLGEPDFEVLSQRLEGTPAIGFLAKLDLKHRFELLLEDIEALNRSDGDRRHQLSSLRERFNDILLRTLAMIREKDPALYKELFNAREAIWLALQSGELMKGYDN